MKTLSHKLFTGPIFTRNQNRTRRRSDSPNQILNLLHCETFADQKPILLNLLPKRLIFSRQILHTRNILQKNQKPFERKRFFNKIKSS